MGQCCKCGKETPHVYAYWSGDAPDRKTCVNVEEHAAFMCTRCAMTDQVINYYCLLAMWIAFLVCSAIDADVVLMIAYGAMAAFWLGVLLHALHVGRHDKKLPFTGRPEYAEKRIVKIMRKRNPGKKYFAPSEYH